MHLYCFLKIFVKNSEKEHDRPHYQKQLHLYRDGYFSAGELYFQQFQMNRSNLEVTCL